MSIEPFGREDDVEALVVDRYLESLLARRPIDADGVPADLELTARRLAGALPRYHPSFRFEEELAARLAAAAKRIVAGEVIAFPDARLVPAPPGERTRVGRPVVIGGVLTSAALSLAGAAFMAWRRSRPTGDPMSRAAQAIARARLV